MSNRPTILSVVTDIPNIITLLGLSSGILGIYLALLGNFPAAIIAMLWAVLFDWYDGPVARRIPGRSDVQKSIGARMDSLVDIVSLAICPAIILLSYGEFNAWFLPGALSIVVAGVVRLAYFDVFGVDDDGTIAGLSLDITALVVALVFLLERVLGHNSFAALLYTTIAVLSFLHVAPFRMHKMVGRWYYVITAYVLILTAVYSYLLWTD
ncbi:MAG: CDP-alcohol phosphatidyltransferase family protein [Candidatus Bipolaricaulota bacterium]|nr:CDP-alcohol phosphatidyltransferase family protein [Candidatus Bipolaricaulota bacterium]